MAQRLTLSICHLYGDLMNTYGDNGNIETIKKRCKWRNISVSTEIVSLGNKLNNDYDFYFFGGGQDKTQEVVSLDLKSKSKAKKIKSAIENGSVLLSVCGGYQLLQKHFKTKDRKIIPGIGLFDACTVGSNDRMIQNLLIKINPGLQKEINSFNLNTKYQILNTNLVGFENHSGKTYLGEKTKPLGSVIIGAGNNGEDKTEGAVYKNAFGCYLHGSLLPKNPHFADYLISKALEKKYGQIKLEPLDDEIEWQAHQSAAIRARSQT